ncbi:helix-turn-helix domain-containing protein [Streptomyces huiliensis]|uniref:helix-turn-helix domain-containing protein n=1 Tax=Streptomyces huiliensis TaxID=2876027 RepID=UPI001CBDB38A|nr:helix-turn-helix transcriptional regulator [Streptomyces huiliensis]MBZ4322385.1 helix-turn-helix domain-containing protein [Streptomyces huiliensis]
MSDENGWELDPEDESMVLVAAVGRQLRLWREAAGMEAAELAAAVGYSRDLVYKVERGLRVPQPGFLERADEALGAGGKLAALREDLAEARYPKKVRDIAKLEREAVELGSYNNSVIDGLLQTEAYARAVFANRRPPFGQDEIEWRVAARMARQEIVTASARRPFFSFVLCEATLRRSVGGRMAMRQQLERLLEIGQWRNVELQVLPLHSEVNSGLEGPFRLLKLTDSTMVGLYEVQLASRVVTDAKELQVLDLRYGVVRAQALGPQESLAFVEKVLGET